MKFSYQSGEESYSIELEKTAQDYLATVREERYEVEVVTLADGDLQLKINGMLFRIHWAGDSGRHWLAFEGQDYYLEKVENIRRASAQSGGGGDNLVCAPMPGQVRDVLVAEGEQVEKGQNILLLEAMKMEIRILAPREGQIVNLAVKDGETVDKDQVLAKVK